MKKVLLFAALFLTVAAQAQLPIQKDSKFYPVFSVGAAIGPKISGRALWTGADVGIQNKNTQIVFGATSQKWGKEELVVYSAISRRVIYAGRFEAWGELGVSTTWREETPFQFQPQYKIVYNYDKALTIYFQMSTNFRTPDYKYYGTGQGIGVTVRIPGRPHQKN